MAQGIKQLYRDKQMIKILFDCYNVVMPNNKRRVNFHSLVQCAHLARINDEHVNFHFATNKMNCGFAHHHIFNASGSLLRI